MELNYTKIASPQQIKTIDEDELKRLKKIASFERRYILGHTNSLPVGMISKKANERVMNSVRYVKGIEGGNGVAPVKKETLLARILITAFVCFPDDKEEDFVRSLLQNGYNTENLLQINELIDVVRSIRVRNHRENSTPTAEELLQINKCNSIIAQLINAEFPYYRINDGNVIMTKINQILASNPELLSEKDKGASRSYGKR